VAQCDKFVVTCGMTTRYTQHIAEEWSCTATRLQEAYMHANHALRYACLTATLQVRAVQDTASHMQDSHLQQHPVLLHVQDGNAAVLVPSPAAACCLSQASCKTSRSWTAMCKTLPPQQVRQRKTALFKADLQVKSFEVCRRTGKQRQQLQHPERAQKGTKAATETN
jgi:hypothetical protein